MCLKGFVIVGLTMVSIDRDFSTAYFWSSSGDSVDFLSETVCTPVFVNDWCTVDTRLIISDTFYAPSVSLFTDFNRITNRRRFSYVTVFLVPGETKPLLFLLVRPA